MPKSYRKLVEALFTGELRDPPRSRGGVSGPEINDGANGIRTVPADAQNGEAFGEVVATGLEEEWVVVSEGDYLGTTNKLTYLATTPKHLTASRLAYYKTLANVRFARFLAEYKAMPSRASVDALPGTTPAGIVTYVYTLHSNPDDVFAATPTGALFRERKTPSGGKPPTYTDHWVFYSDYFAPHDNDTLSIVPDTSASRPATLKAFLTAQLDAQANDPTPSKWKYLQTSYELGALPKTAPAT